MSKKLNVTLPDDLILRIDSYAKHNSMSRSGLLAIAATQYLDSVEAMPDLKKMLAAMSAVVEGSLKGEESPEIIQAKMDAIQQTYAGLLSKGQ